MLTAAAPTLLEVFKHIEDHMEKQNAEYGRADLSIACVEALEEVRRAPELVEALFNDHGVDIIRHVYSKRYGRGGVHIGIDLGVTPAKPNKVPPNKGIPTGSKPKPKRLDYTWTHDYWVATTMSGSAQVKLSAMTFEHVESRIQMLVSIAEGLESNIRKWRTVAERLTGTKKTVRQVFTWDEIHVLDLNGLKRIA